MLKERTKGRKNVLLFALGALLFVSGCDAEELGGWSDGKTNWCFWDDGSAGYGQVNQNVPRYTWDDGVIEKDASSHRFLYTIDGDELVVEPGNCEGQCEGVGTFTRDEELDCTQQLF